MAKLNDVLKDPDFWGDQTTDDDRKFVLGKVPEMKNYSPAQMDIFIRNQDKARRENVQREQDGQEKREAGVKALADQETQQKTWWQTAVAPLTSAVGMGMEAVTEPLVPLARMMQGEGVGAAFGPESAQTIGHGGRAKQTRETAAAGVVPQSPWQAGAMGAQFVPGVGPAAKAVGLAPALGRIGASAVGAGGLQALLGERGAVEGGTAGEVVAEGLTGALKGGTTQAVGEGLRKGASAVNRIWPGAAKRAGEKDTAAVMGAVREISPELTPTRGMQGAGTYFTGSKAAKGDASGAFKQRLQTLEAELNAQQGNPYIKAPELVDAYKMLVKAMGKDQVLGPQIYALAPTQGGFLPDQAAKIISLTGQRLGANQTGLGHMKDEAMDQLVAAVEKTLPKTAQGMLSGARADYAKASGLQELLSPAFKPGKGFQIDMRELQKTLSTDPDFLNRLGKSQLEKLFLAVTRGASKGPGFADTPAGNFNVPYPSTQGAMVAALRNLVSRGKTVGKHPLTLPHEVGAGLGVATTAATSAANRASRKE